MLIGEIQVLLPVVLRDVVLAAADVVADPSVNRLINPRHGVCFRTASDDLNAQFIKEALAQGMSGLKGHRDVGGMRASSYNAFPPAGCEALGQFIRDFAKKHG